MRSTLLAAAAAVIGLQGQALGADDATVVALNDANIEALSYTLNSNASLSVAAQLQIRYDINSRDDDALGDDDTTLGFSMRRTRVDIKGDVTDSISAKVQFEFSRSTGTGSLVEAYADWDISDDVSLRIGQQKLHFLRETTVGSKKTLSAEASVMDSVFTQGYSQFIEAAFGGDNWRGWVAFSDGFDSRNTAYNDGDEADYAFTGRVEFKFGDADWKQFDQFTSFRGAASGGLLGLAAHWQSMGSTNPSTSEVDMYSLTADFGWVADGWNAYGAFVYQSTDNDTSADFDDYGFLIQGGFFVADQTELFARYDFMSPDDNRGAGTDDFSSLTVGGNYYITPESHAAKFTLAFLYYFDAVNDTGGLVSPSDGLNLLASDEDGQWGVTAQLQLLF